MATQTFSANDFIDKNLIALQPSVLGYLNYPYSKNYITFSKGQQLGKVYSWVLDPLNKANVFWMMERPDGSFYYIQHNPAKINIDPKDPQPKSIEQKQKEAEEQDKKDREGTIPYYIGKYGTVLLVVGAGVAITKALINRQRQLA